MRYHKLQTVYKRNMDLPNHPLVPGKWTKEEFEYLKDNQWLWTEKVDGTNIRVYWEDGKVRVEGRNENSQIPARVIERINAIPLEAFATLADGTVLYGEGCGQGIQKNMGFYTENNGVDFVMFDMASIHGNFYPWADMAATADVLGLRHAPLVGVGTLEQAIAAVKGGMVSQLGDGPSEGLVLRPLVEMKNRWDERIICKIKTRDFQFLESGA